MGADHCRNCLFDLDAVDRPEPSDRIEESLTRDPVSRLAPRPPVTVNLNTPVAAVIRAMVAGQVGAVLVVDGEGKLRGIVTERDLLNKVAGEPGRRIGPRVGRDDAMPGVGRPRATRSPPRSAKWPPAATATCPWCKTASQSASSRCATSCGT